MQIARLSSIYVNTDKQPYPGSYHWSCSSHIWVCNVNGYAGTAPCRYLSKFSRSVIQVHSVSTRRTLDCSPRLVPVRLSIPQEFVQRDTLVCPRDILVCPRDRDITLTPTANFPGICQHGDVGRQICGLLPLVLICKCLSVQFSHLLRLARSGDRVTKSYLQCIKCDRRYCDGPSFFVSACSAHWFFVHVVQRHLFQFFFTSSKSFRRRLSTYALPSASI